MKAKSMKLSQLPVSVLCALLTALSLSACQSYQNSETGTAAAAPPSAAPLLTIRQGDSSRQFSLQQLLAMRAPDVVQISDDATYHDTRSYRAVALKDLLGDLSGNGYLQFVASDGFVATLPVAALHSEATAWLAIEDPQQPWPPLKSGTGSAGPLYLVWSNAKAAKISNEQWPYQIAQINVVAALEQRFPQLLPAAAAASQAAALRGMQVYISNCSSCHSLNHGGDAQIGPDLNLPMNPLEYFQESALRKMIRQPASVRSWKQSVMPGFSPQQLSEEDLDDLLVYLRQMAHQKT